MAEEGLTGFSPSPSQEFTSVRWVFPFLKFYNDLVFNEHFSMLSTKMVING